MALRNLITDTRASLAPINDELEKGHYGFFDDVLDILDYVQIGAANEMLEEIRTMLINMLTQALDVVRALDIGQEALAETLNKVQLLGQLISALAGTVQGVSEMGAGLGQQLGPAWDFTAFNNAANGIKSFRDGFTGILNQIPEPGDWAALDTEMNRLQDGLNKWINALQP